MPATAALAAQRLVQHRFLQTSFFIIILGRKMAINSAALLTALARLIRWDNIRVLVPASAVLTRVVVGCPPYAIDISTASQLSNKFTVLFAQLHRALAVPLTRRCQCLRLASELWRSAAAKRRILSMIRVDRTPCLPARSPSSRPARRGRFERRGRSLLPRPTERPVPRREEVRVALVGHGRRVSDSRRRKGDQRRFLFFLFFIFHFF